MKLVKKNIFDEDKTCLWVASVAIGRDGHFFFSNETRVSEILFCANSQGNFSFV